MLSPFPFPSYPKQASILDMNFTCVNDSIICDLYRAIFYTNKKTKKPLRRTKQSLPRSKQSLRRSKQSLWRSKQSLWRSKQSLRRSKQSLWRSKQSLRRSKQSFPKSKQSLQKSEQLKPNEGDVINPQVSKCNLVHLKQVHSTDSSCNYRFSVRKLTKQPNGTRWRRDREPSRLPLKKLY